VRFLSRVKMNMREIRSLEEAASVNRKVAENAERPAEERAEAEQRIAEIKMRIQVLRMENDRL